MPNELMFPSGAESGVRALAIGPEGAIYFATAHSVGRVMSR